MPGAMPMRVDGLSWILEKMQSNNISFKKCGESFARLLNVIWENHQEILRSNPDYFQNFRELLLLLQKDGEPLALELCNRIENLC